MTQWYDKAVSRCLRMQKKLEGIPKYLSDYLYRIELRLNFIFNFILFLTFPNFLQLIQKP